MSRNIIFAPGEYYHLYNRGTEKRSVFKSKADYERFIALLYICNGTAAVRIENLRRNERGSTLLKKALEVDRGTSLVDICAYVLMPNHFHLLLKEKETGGVSRFMQKLTTAYTMYFNKRHARSGALFQGRFKSQYVDGDGYLKYLLSYLHLNPVKLIESKWKETGIQDKKRAKLFLQSYRASSYLDYAGDDRAEKSILNKDSLPNYFETRADFEKHINDWLAYKDQQLEQGSTLLTKEFTVR